MTPKSTAYALLLSVFVALGAASLWGMLIAWSWSFVEQWGEPNPPFDQIVVTLDGEPLIQQTPTGYSYWQSRYLTLDGKLLKKDEVHTAQLQQTLPPGKQQRSNARLAGTNDGRSPATYWYLLHDGEPNGRAYGVGYHATTQQLAGYFGRKGFTHEMPPRDDWFTVAGDHQLRLVTLMPLNREPNFAGDPLLPLLAEGRLWLVDTQQRQVDSIPAPTDAYTLTTTMKVVDDVGKGTKDPAALDLRQFLVRSPKQLTIVDPATKEQFAVAIPERLRRATLAGLRYPNGDILLVAQPATLHDPRRIELVWFDRAGKVTKQRELTLAGVKVPPYEVWLAALMMPLPLGSIGYSVIESYQQMQFDEQLTWSTAVTSTFAKAWPSFACVAMLSLGLAIAAYRRQGSFALPSAGLWAAFVFVFGVPGYLAYRFHRIWPVRETCPRCGKAAPRDRDRCCQCEAAFPPPALTGVEVFA